MILGWKTDMMGLMLAFQFTIIIRVKSQHHSRQKKSSFSIQFGPTPLFHPLKSTIGYPALSLYIVEQ
jgi:hypothetical protein